MADGQYKRKRAPLDNVGPHKKSKGGSSGRWKTPFQKEKEAAKIEMGTALDIGDQGIWVTYARGMKTKAVREFVELCEHYGEDMFGVNSDKKDGLSDNQAEVTDITASIEAELESLKNTSKNLTKRYFTPIASNLDCVFFLKTMDPVDPKKLVVRICEDARACQDPMKRKCKYINRLTPVVDMDKATESGIEKVTRRVLHSHFSLTAPEDQDVEARLETSSEPASIETESMPSHAIRVNVRNHKTFRTLEIIQMIAAIVDPKHKVNLTDPDKVILVEVFQFFCGISVADSKQWEELKRYNVSELYKLASEASAVPTNDKPKTPVSEK